MLDLERVRPERELLSGHRMGIIPLVAPNGEARVRELAADLVVAACQKGYVDKRQAAPRRAAAIRERRRLRAGRTRGNHARAARSLVAEYVARKPAARPGLSLDERRVLLAGPVRGELRCEAGGGLGRSREHHDAADRPVEPVHEA